MMLSSWIQPLHFSIITIFWVGVVEALQIDNACFSWSETPECSQHRLQCDRGTVFLTQASRGFKLDNNTCRPGDALCVNKSVCCRNDAGQDCLEIYTQAAFSDLAARCWNQASCNHRVKLANRTRCSYNYTYPSGYSEVQYVCLDGSAIHDFNDSSAMTASSLALRYLPSHGSGSYVCRVTAEDCTSSTSSVLLTKWPNTQYSQYCSSLAVAGEIWLPCSSTVSYIAYTLTTPFEIDLYIANDKDIAQAWAVINAPTTESTLPRPTSPRTESTAFPPSHSNGTSGTTAGVSCLPPPPVSPPALPLTSRKERGLTRQKTLATQQQ